MPSGQINMRKVDEWQVLHPSPSPSQLASQLDEMMK